jgi:protein-glutamine gamma-glutamyltransferase
MERDLNRRIVLLLLGTLGLATLPHFYNLPISVFSFFFALLTWRVVAVFRPYILPGKVLLFLLSLLGVIILYVEQRSIMGRDAGTSLFIIATSLKLLEIRKERELYLLTYLCFIVAGLIFLFEQSILTGLHIILVCLCLLATLVTLNSDNFRITPAFKKAGIIILQSIPLSIVIFLCFPRIESPRWMILNQKGQAKSGLADTMEPGSISDLALSDELAFRVKFEGKPPPIELRYWRGPVLSFTDGVRWTPGGGQSMQTFTWPKFLGRPYNYKVLMEAQEKNWVFPLDLPSRIPNDLFMNDRFQVFSRNYSVRRAEYDMTSYLRHTSGQISKFEFRRNTQLPGDISPQIIELSEKFKNKSNNAAQYAEQILNFFREEEFSYTLTPPLMENRPIDTFLFEARTGFCSHYAAAFVYLMRVAKIPARVVTGYQGGEFNKLGGFFEIRQANAHAWAEIWIKDRGWTRYDPTAAIAPERISQNINISQQISSGNLSFIEVDEELATSFEWLKNLPDLWSSLDYQWQSWVLNYSPNKQYGFLKRLGISNMQQSMYAILALSGLFTLILFYQTVRPRKSKLSKAIKAYNSFCQILHSHRVTRASGETPECFSRRASAKFPNAADSIQRITALFEKLNYYPQPKDSDLAELIHEIKNFKDNLKH